MKNLMQFGMLPERTRVLLIGILFFGCIASFALGELHMFYSSRTENQITEQAHTNLQKCGWSYCPVCGASLSENTP